jgi:predicted nucleic acid-binding protein
MNRPLFVVDASVVVKWLVREADEDTALRIQDLYRSGDIELLAPRFLILEVGNVLGKRVRRVELTPEAAQRCFDRFLAGLPTLWDSVQLTHLAFNLALAHRQNIYDCVYLALALERRCDLITADEKFVRSMSTAYPFVRLLREF